MINDDNLLNRAKCNKRDEMIEGGAVGEEGGEEVGTKGGRIQSQAETKNQEDLKPVARPEWKSMIRAPSIEGGGERGWREHRQRV